MYEKGRCGEHELNHFIIVFQSASHQNTGELPIPFIFPLAPFSSIFIP